MFEQNSKRITTDHKYVKNKHKYLVMDYFPHHNLRTFESENLRNL